MSSIGRFFIIFVNCAKIYEQKNIATHRTANKEREKKTIINLMKWRKKKSQRRHRWKFTWWKRRKKNKKKNELFHRYSIVKFAITKIIKASKLRRVSKTFHEIRKLISILGECGRVSAHAKTLSVLCLYPYTLSSARAHNIQLQVMKVKSFLLLANWNSMRMNWKWLIRKNMWKKKEKKTHAHKARRGKKCAHTCVYEKKRTK